VGCGQNPTGIMQNLSKKICFQHLARVWCGVQLGFFILETDIFVVDSVQPSMENDIHPYFYSKTQTHDSGSVVSQRTLFQLIDMSNMLECNPTPGNRHSSEYSFLRNSLMDRFQCARNLFPLKVEYCIMT